MDSRESSLYDLQFLTSLVIYLAYTIYFAERRTGEVAKSWTPNQESDRNSTYVVARFQVSLFFKKKSFNCNFIILDWIDNYFNDSSFSTQFN